MHNFALALVDGFFRPCLSFSALEISSQALRLSWLSFFLILSAQSRNHELFRRRNSISPFGWTFLLLLRQLKGLVMAGLAGDVQKPGQKTAARSKAASLGKKSASQRVKTSHPHTENNQVNSANL